MRVVKLIAWILAAGALCLFLRTWLAPDACLDFGGSFNYERWECNDAVNQYVDVRFYELRSFWLFLGVFVGACALQWGWRHSIQQAVAADRPKTGAG
jgi:hypothetical protein